MRQKHVRLLTRLVPAILAIWMIMVTVQTAFAWTHLRNHFDSNPSDFTCGYDDTVPCLYWPEPNHVSTMLNASYDTSLGNIGPAHYNFTSSGVLSNSLGYWNQVQGAFNPLISNCNFSGCVDAVHYISGDLGAFIWAATDTGDFGSVQFANGQYYAIMNSATTTFNTEVSWNNNFQYATLQADGRKVATHETGHIECLGHTSHVAIMQQGDVRFFQPQADDINAMQSIYTGFIPA